MSDHIIDDQAPQSAGCAALDAALADYLDDTLDPASRAAADAHLASCGRCAALLADLEAITAGARALPPLAPSPESERAMWSGIAARIEAPVVPVEEARVALDARRASRRAVVGWRRLGAVAAALVLATAGVTYEVTKVALERDRQQQAGQPSLAQGPAAAPTGAPASAESSAAQLALVPPDVPSPAGGVGSAPAATGRVPQSAPGAAALSVARRASPAEQTYEREITSLRRILRERRADLDSSTAVVLEQNLKVIDRAIAQSRAALERDPRSRFLNQQLNSALDKKVELLRTAALLPART
ncbi:MAG: zf-HC2 domain-containing protein [Gemmatimonadaceae bacterium]